MKLRVAVKPMSRTSELLEVDGVWSARLKAAPIDGKANAELIGLIAAAFKLPKSRVAVVSGASGRFKTVELTGVDVLPSRIDSK